MSTSNQNASRRVLAIFLACIFLTLNFAAEFAHNHYYQSEAATFVDTAESHNLSNDLPFHTRVCVACLFSLSQLAPNQSIQVFTPDHTSDYALTTESTVYFVYQHTAYFLRAPPAA